MTFEFCLDRIGQYHDPGQNTQWSKMTIKISVIAAQNDKFPYELRNDLFCSTILLSI